MQNLQKKLRLQINQSNLSVRDVERLAGLKRCALSNILEGKSKKPSLDTLRATANVLGCSVPDLLDTPQDEDDTLYRSSLEGGQKPLLLPVEAAILCNIIKNLDESFKNINYEPNLEQFWQCVIRAYSYTLGSGDHNVDPKFAEWLVNKFRE